MSDLKYLEDGFEDFKKEIDFYKSKSANELNEKDIFLKDSISYYDNYYICVNDIRKRFDRMEEDVNLYLLSE
jgi:hypothetical protein